MLCADVDESGGRRGTFFKTDLTGDNSIEACVAEVANLFVFGFSHHGQYLIGGDLLFDGGVVKTY